MSTPSTISGFSPSNSSRKDHKGWLAAIVGGLVAGALIGSGDSGMFYWDRLPGPVTAGVAVALLTSLVASSRMVAKTLIASLFVVGSCLMTITLRHWSTGHWNVGHVEGKFLIIGPALLVYVGVPGLLVSFVAAAVRNKSAGQGAAPNK